MLRIELINSADFTDALYRYRQTQQTLAGLSLTQIEEGVLSNLRKNYLSVQVDLIDFCLTKSNSIFMTYFKG